MEETEEFDFRTGNGGVPGNKGGRPTKKFLEQKEALEALQAIEKLFPGAAAELLGKFENRSKANNKRDDGGGLRGTLEGLIKSPLLGILAPFGGAVATIGALWVAEEYVKLPVQRFNDVEVDDKDRPIIERRRVSTVGADRDQTESLRFIEEQSFEDVVVGFEKKTIRTQTTEYVSFPPILHSTVNILIWLLPLLTQALEFLGGNVTEVLDKAKNIFDTLSDGEFNSKDVKVVADALLPWAGFL